MDIVVGAAPDRSNRPADRRRTRSAPRSRARMAGVSALALLVGLIVPMTGAGAKPPNPSDRQIRAAQRQHQADVAALGVLAGRIAAVDGDITRTRTALDLAVAAYNETGRELQKATAEVTRTGAAQRAAQREVDGARDDARVQIRTSYMRGPLLSIGSVALSDDPSALIGSYDLRRYLAVRSQDAVTRLALATVAASNAGALARQAEDRARELQARAARQRDEVLRALKAFQIRQAALVAQRSVLDRQAALAYGRVRQLRTQRAAFLAWAADVRRKRAAEAARQAALERQRQREVANSGAPLAAPLGAPASAGSWGNPMSAGAYTISTCFCMRWGVFHWGVDFAAGYGTPIHAIGAGRVASAGPAQGFGNWVVIDHGSGTYSVYGHMRVLKVSTGQRVQRGQVIALVGSEGESTGPHLHLEIRLGGIEGTKVDPQVWLAQRGVYIE